MQSKNFILRTHRIHTLYIGVAPYATLYRHFVAGSPQPMVQIRRPLRKVSDFEQFIVIKNHKFRHHHFTQINVGMQSITFILRTNRIHTVFIGFAPYAHLNHHFVAGSPQPMEEICNL